MMDVTPPQAESDAQKAAIADSADVAENKDIAALGYVWILSVFVYFAKHQSPFVRFHARQGIVLFALSVGVWFVPYVGRVLELIILALAVYGFVAAAQGLWKELPLIGPLTRGDKAGMRGSWKNIVNLVVHGWRKARTMPTDEPTTPPSPPVA